MTSTASPLPAPVLLINQQLPQLAGLTKATFLERVANVEAIRTREVPVSLLLEEKSQMGQLEVLHAAVQTGSLPIGLPGFYINAQWVPFVVEIPVPLFHWLARHSLDEVKGQVVNWMAALHAAHCQRFQMWRKLSPEIRRWAGAHYTKYNVRQADALIDVWAREFDSTQHRVGGATPGVLVNPFWENERPFLDKPEVLASYRFTVRVSYFRKDDWLSIVVRSRARFRRLYQEALDSGEWTEAYFDQQFQARAVDKMNRIEADRQLWQAWRERFTAGS